MSGYQGIPIPKPSSQPDPTINHMMASLVIEAVRRMVARACPFMSLYLDMDQGTVTPADATPEDASRVVDRRLEVLSEEDN